jgi:P27 family predicted phage terminase small subunit
VAGVKGRSGGWNRKSAEQHLISGTYRRDRHGPVALASVNPQQTEPPEPPASLSPTAREAWRRYMQEFEAWSAGDLRLLELALHAQDRAEQCRRRLKADGLVLRARRGGLRRVHPLVRVEKAAIDFMITVFKQLGLVGGRGAADA